jgi:hypothetical protein
MQKPKLFVVNKNEKTALMIITAIIAFLKPPKEFHKCFLLISKCWHLDCGKVIPKKILVLPLLLLNGMQKNIRSMDMALCKFNL